MEIGASANAAMVPLVAEEGADYLIIYVLFFEITLFVVGIFFVCFFDVQQAPKASVNVGSDVSVSKLLQDFPLM